MAADLCLERPIKLALYNHGFLYEQSSGTGIDKDVANELIKRSGCAFTLSEAPRARIWIDLAEGSLDMATSGIETAARNQFAVFAHYIAIKNFALALDDQRRISSLTGLVDQIGLRVGVVRGYVHDPQIDATVQALRSLGRVTDLPDIDSTFRMLADDRVQVVFGQPVIFAYFAKKMNLSARLKVSNVTPDIPRAPHGLVISRQSFTPAQQKAWQDLTSRLVKDGTIRRIVGHYLPPDLVRQTLLNP